MSKMNYAELFNLKPNERKLHILVCSSAENVGINKISNTLLARAEFIGTHELPHLAYKDQSFDLVLCHNVLFQESGTHSFELDKSVLLELMRIGSEVRVLPIVGVGGTPLGYLGNLMQDLQEKGVGIELREVQINSMDSPFAMLRLWKATCEVP